MKFCDHSLNISLNITDRDFIQTIQKVNDLTKDFEYLVSQIQQNTREPLKKSIELKDDVLNDKIVSFLNEIDLSDLLNQTSGLFDLNKKSEVTLEDVNKFNEEIYMDNSKVNLALFSERIN